jgi:hypothetical protein
MEVAMEMEVTTWTPTHHPQVHLSIAPHVLPNSPMLVGATASLLVHAIIASSWVPDVILVVQNHSLIAPVGNQVRQQAQLQQDK